MVTSSPVEDRFVIFRDGTVVPAPAYCLLLDLERRGFTLTIDGSILVVRPPERLTRQDVASIRRWKFHLMHLIRCCALGVDDRHLFTDAPAARPVARTA